MSVPPHTDPDAAVAGDAVAQRPGADAPGTAADPSDAGAVQRTITSSVVLMLLGRGAGMLASLVTVALTTRHLGVAGYGLLTTAVVFVGIWTSLTELGVGAVIVRQVAAGRGQLRELAGVNLGLSLLYCVPLAVVAGALGLLIYHGEPRVHGVLLVVSGSLVLSAIGNCFQPVFMSRVRFGAVAASDVISRVLTLAATGIVIWLHGGLVWFGVVQLVPPLAQLVVLAVGTYRLGELHVRFDLAAGLSLLRASLPQTGVLIIGVLYWRADALLLTLLGSVREVGAYGLAYTAAFTLSVLSTFYLASSLSTMSARWTDDRAGFRRFVGSGIEAMLFLGLPIAALGAVAARPLITLLGSERFAAAAATPLALLLVSVALTFLTGVLSQALFAADDQRFLLRLNIVNLVVNIALNVALIPLIGAVGSAIALLVSEVSGLVITSWRLTYRSGYRTPWVFAVRLLPPAALSAAAAWVLLELAGVEVLVVLVVAGIVYLGANLVLGPVRLATIRELRST